MVSLVGFSKSGENGRVEGIVYCMHCDCMSSDVGCHKFCRSTPSLPEVGKLVALKSYLLVLLTSLHFLRPLFCTQALLTYSGAYSCRNTTCAIVESSSKCEKYVESM